LCPSTLLLTSLSSPEYRINQLLAGNHPARRHNTGSANAILTTAFARLGFSGDYGDSYFLTQPVGSAKARELYFLSDRVTRLRGRLARGCAVQPVFA
jgi:hypothetical protein